MSIGKLTDVISSELHAFDEYLKNILEYNLNKYQSDLFAPMRYSLFSGGKRVRYRVCINYAKLLGISVEKVLPIAAAIEMIHTYSLMHDDLPAMDNDDFRRNLPSCHKKYDESGAILGGCMLKVIAYDIIIQYEYYSIEQKIKILELLNRNLGNLLIGQYSDLHTVAKSLEEILQIYKNKTCALFMTIFEATCIVANIPIDYDIGYLYGIIFQIQDDIEDFDQNKQEQNICHVISKEDAQTLLNQYITDLDYKLKKL